MSSIFKKFLIFFVIVLSSYSTNLKAENECFEKVSRSIFKFNMALDNAVIGPISNAYNKLPAKLKAGTGNVTSNIGNLL